MPQIASVATRRAPLSRNARASDPRTSFQASHAPMQVAHEFGNQAMLRLQRKCDCGGAPDCHCDTGSNEREPNGGLHRSPAGPGPMQSPAIVHEVLRSPGQPLDAATQAFFESRFGGELSGVRIHDDSQAAASAHAVQALGYTVGQHIAFALGQYQPGTDSGRRLLAHELAHTFQQRGAPSDSGPLLVSSATGPDEQAADGMAGEALAAPGKGVGPTQQQTKSGRGPSAASAVARSVSSTLLQRQIQATCSVDPFKIAKALGGDKSAALDILNCCESGLSPLPAGCTKDVIDGLRKLLGKKPGQKNTCPSGFHPGRTKDFQGQCCMDNTSESEQNCCPADRAGNFGKCCPVGQVAQGLNCVSPPPVPAPPLPDICPKEWKTPLGGKCCVPPQIPFLFDCIGPGLLNPPGPVNPTPGKQSPTPTPTPTPVASPVFFNFDRPHVGEGQGALNSSLTGEGATNLKALIAQLKMNPSLKVQLVGRASPEGDSKYNLDLGARRAQLVAGALTNAGIGAAQIADAPGAGTPPGCQPVGTGVSTCGEIGATGEPDRQVSPTLFATGAPPSATP